MAGQGSDPPTIPLAPVQPNPPQRPFLVTEKYCKALLARALESKVGLKVKDQDPHRLRQRLYVHARELDLQDKFRITIAPDATAVWIIKLEKLSDPQNSRNKRRRRPKHQA